jgi:hypothetical protein
MIKIVSEATIIGLITLTLGRIIIELIIKENKNNRIKKPKGIYFAFFFTGFLLHFIIEYLGINCWYCDKKCIGGLKNIVT